MMRAFLCAYPAVGLLARQSPLGTVARCVRAYARQRAHRGALEERYLSEAHQSSWPTLSSTPLYARCRPPSLARLRETVALEAMLRSCRLPHHLTYGVELELIFLKSDEADLCPETPDLEQEFTSLLQQRLPDWLVKQDGSIEWNDDDDDEDGDEDESGCGSDDDGDMDCSTLELVSPRLHGKDGIHNIMRTCRAIQEFKPRVNRTTALHVHVGSTKDWDLQHLKNLCINWIYFEPALDLLVPESRRRNNNTYCRSVLLALGGDPVEATARIQAAPDQNTLIRLVNPRGRNYKLNLQALHKYGTVEFRHTGGSYNGDKIAHYVLLYVSFVLQLMTYQAALNPWSDHQAKLYLTYVLQCHGYAVPRFLSTDHMSYQQLLDKMMCTMYSRDPEVRRWIPERIKQLAAASGQQQQQPSAKAPAGLSGEHPAQQLAAAAQPQHMAATPAPLSGEPAEEEEEEQEVVGGEGGDGRGLEGWEEVWGGRPARQLVAAAALAASPLQLLAAPANHSQQVLLAAPANHSQQVLLAAPAKHSQQLLLAAPAAQLVEPERQQQPAAPAQPLIALALQQQAAPAQHLAAPAAQHQLQAGGTRLLLKSDLQRLLAGATRQLILAGGGMLAVRSSV